jgi:hypothetical protein
MRLNQNEIKALLLITSSERILLPRGGWVIQFRKVLIALNNQIEGLWFVRWARPRKAID